MCNQFQGLPLAVVRDLARQLAAGAVNEADFAVGSFAGEDARLARPGSDVAVIVLSADGTPKALELTWGFQVPWQGQLVYNTRIEKAVQPDSMWAQALAQGRCIIPVTCFYERHRTEVDRSLKTGRPVKRRYRFSMGAGELFFLAGVCESDRFSVVTTEPNASVSPVHNRMPIALPASEAFQWLGDGFARLADRSGLELGAVPDSGGSAATQLSLL